MTFIAATATGPAVDDLQRHVQAAHVGSQIHMEHHRDKAVAWNRNHPLVSSEDDGDVLVILDGQLHNLWGCDRPAARLLHDRYRELGFDLARGLLGDFVIIVLDRTRDSLAVCRDPLGVRPWYQSGDNRRTSGATDIATVRALPWVNREVNEVEALTYLTGLVRSQGSTLYRGIKTLPPGSTWRAAGGVVTDWKHHNWRIHPEFDVTWDEAVERCRDTLDEVVRCRIRATGPATCHLSGGLDSSAVTGTAVLVGAESILVGRLLFTQPEADERTYSDAVIERWGVPAVSVEPWIPTEAEAYEWTAHLQYPIPHPSTTMFASLNRAFLDEGRSVVMSGIGGDDAFIDVSRSSLVLSAFRNRQRDVLRSVLAADLRRPRSAWRDTWRGVAAHHMPWRHCLPISRPWLTPSPLSPAFAKRSGFTEVLKRQRVYQLTGDAAVDERAAGLTSGYLAAILERAAMVDDQTGCRMTHPFLDPRFIEATYGLNPWFSLRGGHDRALAADAYADRIPPNVQNRRTKAHFSGVSQGATLGNPEAVAQLMAGPLVNHGWIQRSRLADLAEEAGHSWDADRRLFRALSLDRWLRVV